MSLLISKFNPMPTKIFLNLAVKDLNKSKEFFSKLGYTFNPQFTDENAACMIISDNIFVMLVIENFFKTFTKKEIADSSKTTEALICISAESKEKVDEIVKKALAAGGKALSEKQDVGWMYSWSFYDLDGHHWEVAWMDATKMPTNNQ